MNAAIELAKILENSASISRNGKLMIAKELRRLAEIERKYNEIMAQEPVGWFKVDDYREHHGCTDNDRALSKGWTPLYTLSKD